MLASAEYGRRKRGSVFGPRNMAADYAEYTEKIDMAAEYAEYTEKLT
jgi:hypothetical protein